MSTAPISQAGVCAQISNGTEASIAGGSRKDPAPSSGNVQRSGERRIGGASIADLMRTRLLSVCLDGHDLGGDGGVLFGLDYLLTERAAGSRKRHKALTLRN